MWHLLPEESEAADNKPPTVIGPDDAHSHDEGPDGCKMRWDCVWRCRTASPVTFLRFSPDGALFVSAGKSDRLVKIWYESAAKTSYARLSGSAVVQDATNHPMSELDYSFIYIAHPRAITGVSWRKTSKYIPRGFNANILVTSCRDNVCRLWIQTLLPGEISSEQRRDCNNFNAQFQTTAL